MTWLLLMLLTQASSSLVEAPISAPPVADVVLADQRGGIRLPNGIDVALAVQTQTALNGAVLLRTVFQLDQGAPTFTIYAPRSGEVVALESAGTQQRTPQPTGPTISYERGVGLQVTPAAVAPVMSVSAAGSVAGGLPPGLTEVVAGAVTDAGSVSQSAERGTQTVSLSSSDLTITHLAGNAFGSAIANSGSDRAIDTQTTVSITLSNAGPDVLGSAMFRVQDIALNAIALRGN